MQCTQFSMEFVSKGRCQSTISQQSVEVWMIGVKQIFFPIFFFFLNVHFYFIELHLCGLYLYINAFPFLCFHFYSITRNLTQIWLLSIIFLALQFNLKIVQTLMSKMCHKYAYLMISSCHSTTVNFSLVIFHACVHFHLIVPWYFVLVWGDWKFLFNFGGMF